MTDLSKIADPAVRAALDAFQKGDKAGWLAAFASDAELTDDGNPRSFFGFSNDALGHERFTSIDEVEEGGLSVTGQYHSDQWGNFRTFFKFHVGAGGKFERLDIGQAG
ncbi:hypothetical protein LMIY3S_05786 [Labrys miyagiensis]